MSLFKAWLKAAAIRALKTAAETALSMITVGAAIADVDWVHVFSCTAVAAFLSILWSLKGIPEVGSGADVGVIRYADKVMLNGDPVDMETEPVDLEGEENAGN